MSELIDLVRRTVREELALHRGPQLATVTALIAHESADDSANYEVDLRLKHDGLELPQVPVAVPHIGVAAPPRVGDLVLVSFLDHDIQQPFVTGRFYTDQERAPLFKEDDVLFEHRLPDGTLNHLRMAADGSLFLQRDVTKPEDNTEFKAGIRIDPQGLIELKSGDELVLTIDPQGGKVTLLSKDKPVEITCQTLKVDGDVQITKTLTVDGDGTIKGTGKISSVTISGTDISGRTLRWPT
jgi:phage baseplate assembly protein gpV